MKKPQPKKVMVFGTFDLIHKGHVYFLRQAKRYGGKNAQLVVSIARDINVKKIKRSKPVFKEKQRLENVKKLQLAAHVILGDKGHYIRHIKKVQPDIIVLGYDQTAYTKTLKKDLARAGLKPKIIRARPHKPEAFKSSKLRAKML